MACRLGDRDDFLEDGEALINSPRVTSAGARKPKAKPRKNTVGAVSFAAVP